MIQQIRAALFDEALYAKTRSGAKSTTPARAAKSRRTKPARTPGSAKSWRTKSTGTSGTACWLVVIMRDILGDSIGEVLRRIQLSGVCLDIRGDHCLELPRQRTDLAPVQPLL